jgi:hypothetical protein
VSSEFRISSFFDVFLEISTDGGATWQPAVAAVTMPLAEQVWLLLAWTGTYVLIHLRVGLAERSAGRGDA